MVANIPQIYSTLNFFLWLEFWFVIFAIFLDLLAVSDCDFVLRH
jgi:hypothetical protein